MSKCLFGTNKSHKVENEPVASDRSRNNQGNITNNLMKSYQKTKLVLNTDYGYNRTIITAAACRTKSTAAVNDAPIALLYRRKNQPFKHLKNFARIIYLYNNFHNLVKNVIYRRLRQCLVGMEQELTG